MQDGRVTGLEVSGQFGAFDKAISTIPLPHVARLMPDLPLIITRKTGVFPKV